MSSTIHHDKIKTYLALGDSYTIGESVPLADRYPIQTVKMLEAERIHFSEPKIIATTGWTTNDLLSAMNRTTFADQYDVVSLLIGVNNQYQGRSKSEYENEFATLLEKAIRLAGNRPDHVVVLSIPDYSVTPFARNSDTALISSEIDAFNAINKKISDNHRVHYISVTEESRKALTNPSLIAEDGLHFSGKEYEIWAEKLAKIINTIFVD
ncbi:MAG: SGNH/GDSL hydrolase family protein [Bacteroidetes bacterium]|nr:SGNH/GDSL hydrolase family protein [Bacteroidota bacterium]